mmetsp:Transcript_23912/g.35546  ORF Transcript_23912/g.35546 Transcript_23912/m.35546 type:complete len:239 (-) Transcript_23912:1199-1915(-)
MAMRRFDCILSISFFIRSISCFIDFSIRSISTRLFSSIFSNSFFISCFNSISILFISLLFALLYNGLSSFLLSFFRIPPLPSASTSSSTSADGASIYVHRLSISMFVRLCSSIKQYISIIHSALTRVNTAIRSSNIMSNMSLMNAMSAFRDTIAILKSRNSVRDKASGLEYVSSSNTSSISAKKPAKNIFSNPVPKLYALLSSSSLAPTPVFCRYNVRNVSVNASMIINITARNGNRR